MMVEPPGQPRMARVLEIDDGVLVAVEFRFVKERAGTVRQAAELGIKVGLIRPITLWPFPQTPFRKLRRSVKAFLDVEMNAGQMQEDLERVVGPDTIIHHLGQGGGKIIYPDEVYEEIKKIMKG